MVITPQFIFTVLGIVAFAASAILLVAAIVYFLRNDIRGVMDDLSGKTRQGERTGTQRRSRRSVTVRSANSPAAASSPDEAIIREAPGGVVQPLEDDLDTVLDTKLRKVPQDLVAINSDVADVNDDIPTVVTSLGDYHQIGMSQSNLNDDDMPTEVEGTAVSDGSPFFVVTRSILAIHSNEIITAE